MKPMAIAGTIPFSATLSFATPIKPLPAIVATEVFVIALMSSGTSCPLKRPPRSIARCAAAA